MVLICGRHVFTEDALLRVSDVRIWLDDEDKERMRQILMERQQWHLSPNKNASLEVEEEFVKRQAILFNGELLLIIEHGTST